MPRVVAPSDEAAIQSEKLVIGSPHWPHELAPEAASWYVTPPPDHDRPHEPPEELAAEGGGAPLAEHANSPQPPPHE